MVRLNAPAGVLFGALAFFASACAQESSGADPRRTITVSGIGEVAAAPDMAMITAGVVTQAASARAAMTANSEAMASVFAGLQEFNIEARDIQTTSLNLNPQYRPYRSGENTPPEIVGYQAHNSLRIRVRDIDRLGVVLDGLTTSGANEFNGVSFAISDTEELMNDARRNAVSDARAKAELLASAAGARLGRVMMISESGGGAIAQPFRAQMELRASAVPIAGGEESLTAAVTIVYELQ